MPAIWVINPLCMSRGWGLIRTVILWDMNGTSGAITKGVVSDKNEQSSSCSLASPYGHLPQFIDFFVFVTISVPVPTLDPIRRVRAEQVRIFLLSSTP